MKKVVSLILFLTAAFALNAEVVWEGTHSTGGNWNALQLPIANHAMLSHVSAGDVIAITVSEVDSEADDGSRRIDLQNSSWQGLGYTQYAVTPGVYPFALTEEAANEVRTNGFIVTGMNYTLTKVEILYQIPLWTGEVDDTNGWAQSATIDKSTFAGLSEGSVIGFNVAEVHDGLYLQYLLRAGADWDHLQNIIHVSVAEPHIGVHTLSASDVTALQTSDIIDIGVSYIKVTALYTYMEHKYYAPGLEDWTVTAHPMSESDGIWSYSFTPASSWNEYKISRGTWATGYQWGPAVIDNAASDIQLDEYDNHGNIHFNTYGEDVTIYWNPATEKSWVIIDDAETFFDTISVTMAGTDLLFGSSWAPTDTENDMVLSDGLYTWSTAHLYVSESSTVKYKAVMGHSWDRPAFGNSDGSDCEYTLGVGYHDITITFDWKTKALQLTDNCYPKVELAGEFNEWTPAEMNWDTERTACTLVVGLNQGQTYDFRTVKNNAATWLGANAYMKRYVCTEWNLNEDANCHIVADETGEYTFIYYANGKVSVIYPNTYTRQFNEVKYGTICLPAAAELSNAKAYSVTAVSDEEITIDEVVGSLEAGVPYIIKPLEVGDVVATFEGETVVAPVNNYLYGTFDGTSLNAGDNAYILSDNQFRLISEEATASVGMYKAYLKMTAANAPTLRIVEAEHSATGMENLGANEVATKFVENGKLYIVREGVVYDMTGKVVR